MTSPEDTPVKLKFPSKSEVVPVCVPLIITLTPGKGPSVDESDTDPTRVESCATIKRDPNKMINDNNFVFIYVFC